MDESFILHSKILKMICWPRNRFILFIILLSTLASCNRHKTLFETISSDQSGIHFNNEIKETDSLNVLNISNIYNGGGVGIGDFNQDGLPDIYFTGNLVPNKLYLNKGNFKFEDITAASGADGGGKWCRGVSVVDINNDGWPDIYVAATIDPSAEKRKNLLYINQGLNKNGIPWFKEMAAEYGLADTSYSTMAAFFDYDNDGDLDMYLVVNQIVNSSLPNVFHPLARDGSFPSSGKLFRNDWNDSLKHPVFKDVSKEAGVAIEGYGHSVNINDFNQDGWKDIYVSNDYLPNDLLLINNHDGTFTDHLSDYFKHSSSNSMGVDVNDVNNDGLEDVMVLDMNPEDNFRKKMMLNPGSYLTYQNSDYFGYNYQYVRNTLQLNQGPRVNRGDSIGPPVFSDISFYAGVAETDWSWTPLLTDFDNDGFRDLIITNGFPKDVTDHDFIAFRNLSSSLVSTSDLLKQIPEVKLHNYAYHNEGNLHFTDVSREWGLGQPSFSNGAAYADLDNDGFPDLIVNNINDEAGIYRNKSRENQKEPNHFLKIKFRGDSLNRDGFGARVELHYDHGKQQVFEHTPYRGYLSTMEDIAFFGLGKTSIIDTVSIKWPGGKLEILKQVSADQLLQVNKKDAKDQYGPEKNPLAVNNMFTEVTDSLGLQHRDLEKDYIDFNIQKLLPHKLSDYGPALAVGDIDGNGLEDLIIGGPSFNSETIFLQQADGRFIQKPLLGADSTTKSGHDMGLLLFDADGDGDLDLYIASGGNELQRYSGGYQDRFYLNDGKGNFTPHQEAIPKNLTSKFCVRAADFDHDGDLDLFVSGRVDPGNYPRPVSSFIWRNDSKDGHVVFTDVTQTVAADLVNCGMVCDAIFTDFNNDGWPDLIMAGEWMSLAFLKNDHGKFVNVTEQTGISNLHGWWNSITAGDFDHDGDMDYIVGNLGQNSFYRGNSDYPVHVYAKDFDNNGIFDMITSVYLPDQSGKKKEFPAEGRDDLLKQVNAMRKKFPTYRSYAVAGMDQVLSDSERRNTLIMAANDFETALLRNDGNGNFSLIPLPKEAQFSMINGMVADDFDGDGNLDLVMSGNDFGTEVSVGRYDAFNGLFLSGDGQNGFKPKSILESGIFIPGNGKALVKIAGAGNQYLLAASQNRGPLKVFRLKENQKILPLSPSDVKAVISYKNGKTLQQEYYYGSSFLSQSGRFLRLSDRVSEVEITDGKGVKRKLKF
jgi:ASPIC and UnbV/FG-GAP-like repeat